jgi:hypothetical protein
MVDNRDLVTHELSIATGTALSDKATTAEQNMPVPYSV